jgi:anthranilate phosphoribosyltransferase
MDEITTTGPTLAFEIREGSVERRELNPSDFDVPVATAASLLGGEKARHLEIARAVLAGERGPARDIVLVNSAAALVAAGHANTFLDGVARAVVSLDSGAARAKVEALRLFTQHS